MKLRFGVKGGFVIGMVHRMHNMSRRSLAGHCQRGR